MIGSLGNLALLSALAFASFGTLSALLAALNASEAARIASRRALYLSCGLVLIAVICLATLLVTNNYHYAYVYQYSNRALPTIFKLTAVWGGHQGSLLWWSLILCSFSAVFLYSTRKLSPMLLSWTYVFVGMAIAFFLMINNFNANPFEVWNQVVPDQGIEAFMPADGRGLNPQLQHWAMIIHPPLLYTGYIGFLFPFALALAALIVRLEGREWIRITRMWTLTAWLILSVGIVLGGGWAYMELGWGGYWAWDPVENASFMPWLLGTAFLHSVMAQETRGMFKLWNVVLILSTYIMCMFGTFITRSGLISSVHAFAESDIWMYYLAYIIVNTIIGLVVIILRRDQLRDDNVLKNATSRESSLLFNNILLICICGVMFLATMYPIFTEWIYDVKRELRHGFYNKIELPLFMALIVLMAFGPILKWKKSSDRDTLKHFKIPFIGAVLSAFIAIPLFKYSWMAYVSTITLVFLIFSMCIDFWGAILRRSKRAKEGMVQAFLSLVHLNQRRYGGYVVHFGVFLIAIGITGAAFNRESKGDLGVGESIQMGPYAFQVEDIGEYETDNFFALTAKVNLLKGGEVVQQFEPEQRIYKSSQSQASEVAISSSAIRDFYVVLAGVGQAHSAEHPVVTLHLYINPLVMWVWIGTFFMTVGTLLSMFGHLVPIGVRARNELPQGVTV